jgi:hypothetical protein
VEQVRDDGKDGLGQRPPGFLKKIHLSGFYWYHL